MPVVTDTSLIQLGADFIFNHLGFFHKILLCIHWCPLKWSKRLRHKERCADVDLYLAFTLFFRNYLIIGLCDLLCQMSNSLHIVFCFCWKAKHKVKFYLIPAAFERLASTMEDHFLCQSFVDNVTETLRTGLRCKSQATFLYILHFTHNIQRKSIDPERRKRDIDRFSMELLDQEIHQFFQLGIITGT